MKKLFLAAVISVSLIGCGSDDSAQSIKAPTPQTVEGSIEFIDLNTNQITVNGHSYNADSIIYNNTKLTLNRLQKNMTVTISTTAKAGTQVLLDPTIVGIVTERNGNNFTINGIALTFANLADDIKNGQTVMVSSLPTANAGYKVLSVVRLGDDILIGQSEIEGTISELDENHLTFKIAGLVTVSYNVNDIEDGEALANGQWVEVEGLWDKDSATFTATEIEVEDYDDLGDDNEIEGVITWVANDLSSFELNSRGRFLINNQTEFDDGNRNNLISGAMVEVNSIKQGNNRVATEVEFEGKDNDDWNKFEFEVDGIVSGVISSGDIISSFKINNKTVLTDVNTVYDDGLHPINFIDGMCVEVEGVIINGNNIAREIELDDEYSCNF